MAAYEVNGKSIAHDEEGYLEDIGEWNLDVAKVIAK